jgi:hypothetical protein
MEENLAWALRARFLVKLYSALTTGPNCTKPRRLECTAHRGKVAADDLGLLFLLTLSGYCFCNRLEDHGSSAQTIAEAEIRINRIRAFFIVMLVSKAKV